MVLTANLFDTDLWCLQLTYLIHDLWCLQLTYLIDLFQLASFTLKLLFCFKSFKVSRALIAQWLNHSRATAATQDRIPLSACGRVVVARPRSVVFPGFSGFLHHG